MYMNRAAKKALEAARKDAAAARELVASTEEAATARAARAAAAAEAAQRQAREAKAAAKAANQQVPVHSQQYRLLDVSIYHSLLLSSVHALVTCR